MSARLLLTERRLRQHEHQLRIAAEMGETLLRQQEEGEERERALHAQLEAAEADRLRLRDELDRTRDEKAALVTSLSTMQQSAVDAQHARDDALDTLSKMRAEQDREREKHRATPSDDSVRRDNDALRSLSAALEAQVRALSERVAAVTKEAEEDRRGREEAEREVREWATAVEERDAAASAAKDAHREEVAELRYRMEQLQELLPVSPPARSPHASPFPALVDEEDVGDWDEPGMEVGRNLRLSTMGYDSLLAELEHDLDDARRAHQHEDSSAADRKADGGDTDGEKENSDAASGSRSGVLAWFSGEGHRQAAAADPAAAHAAAADGAEGAAVAGRRVVRGEDGGQCGCAEGLLSPGHAVCEAGVGGEQQHRRVQRQRGRAVRARHRGGCAVPPVAPVDRRGAGGHEGRGARAGDSSSSRQGKGRGRRGGRGGGRGRRGRGKGKREGKKEVVEEQGAAVRVRHRPSMSTGVHRGIFTSKKPDSSKSTKVR